MRVACADGLVLGLIVSLQMLSSIYYGIFLGTLMAFCGILLFVADRRTSPGRAALALIAGAVLAAVICGFYSVPYMQTSDTIGGERPTEQIVMFSARPSSYLVATPTNWLYGGMLQSRGRGERRLFPGFLVLVLAICGLLLKPPSARAIVYLVALIVAFETSLGFGGFIFGVLHDHVVAYRALRAPARLGVFVLMFLGVLAGYGYIAVARGLPSTRRRWMLAAILLGLMIEYRAPPDLTSYATTPSEVYVRLRQQPLGVVAELPASSPAFAEADAEYIYMSVFHWFPLVNGYSGVYPPSYLRRRARLEHFPDPAALLQLRADGVRYVVIHTGKYKAADLNAVLDAVARSGAFLELGAFGQGTDLSYLYAFR